MGRASPRGVGINSIVIIGPNRGIPLSKVIASKDTCLSATTLANRAGPSFIGRNSGILDNAVYGGDALRIEIRERCNRSAITGVLRVIRGTDRGGTPTRGFVARFSGVCAPLIIFKTLLLTAVPPLFFKNTFAS